MGRSRWSRMGGLTLVELMVVLAVLIILQAVAASAMGKAADNFQLAASSSALLSSFQLARSEAIKRNSRVVVCRSPTGQYCSDTGDWQDGWIVFHDATNNARVDPGEEILFRAKASAPHVRLTGNSTVAAYVSYTSTGTARHVSGAFQAGTFTVCGRSEMPAEGRQLVLSSTGYVRSVKLTVTRCG